MLTRALVCSSSSVSACLYVVGPLSVTVVINQNLEHGGLQNLPNDDEEYGEEKRGSCTCVVAQAVVFSKQWRNEGAMPGESAGASKCLAPGNLHE